MSQLMQLDAVLGKMWGRSLSTRVVVRLVLESSRG